jgi:hypothetical protein
VERGVGVTWKWWRWTTESGGVAVAGTESMQRKLQSERESESRK